MDLDTAVARATDVAADIGPRAAQHDKTAEFCTEAVAALGSASLLGLTLPEDVGGAGLGPRALARVIAVLAEADASAAMVFLMHAVAAATIASADRSSELEEILRDIAAGRHLTTLAFSEAGSRSHFWAPVSRAVSLNGTGVEINATKSFVTSAGHAQSYIVSSLSPEGKGPTDSTLYLVRAKDGCFNVSEPWAGMGLRANASAPMSFVNCRVSLAFRLTAEGGGFQAMLGVVLPLFTLGTAAVALGLCRATIAGTSTHLRTARFEHLGATLGEALPNLRAQLAEMQIQADGLAARIDDTVSHMEHPSDATLLRVLEVKAAAGETAITVTSLGMRVCGGAAFSSRLGIDRQFRDAHAGAIMAPTGDVLREFIGKALLGMPVF